MQLSAQAVSTALAALLWLPSWICVTHSTPPHTFRNFLFSACGCQHPSSPKRTHTQLEQAGTYKPDDPRVEVLLEEVREAHWKLTAPRGFAALKVHPQGQLFMYGQGAVSVSHTMMPPASKSTRMYNQQCAARVCVFCVCISQRDIHRHTCKGIADSQSCRLPQTDCYILLHSTLLCLCPRLSIPVVPHSFLGVRRAYPSCSSCWHTQQQTWCSILLASECGMQSCGSSRTIGRSIIEHGKSAFRTQSCCCWPMRIHSDHSWLSFRPCLPACQYLILSSACVSDQPT